MGVALRQSQSVTGATESPCSTLVEGSADFERPAHCLAQVRDSLRMGAGVG